MKSVLVAFLAFSAAIQPVLGAQCSLEQAVYVERDQGYELRFFPATNRDAANTTLRFFVVRPDDDRNLSGEISGNLGVSRDTGTARRDCPTDKAPTDITEAEWQDCTYWKGLVYQIADGLPEMLPFPQDPAPQALLLTDFGRQIRYSGLLDGPANTPWDVFTLAGCRW